MFKLKSKKKCLFILITIFCLFVIAPSIAVNAGTKNGWLDQENLDSMDTHDGTALDKTVMFEFWLTSSKAIKQNNKLYIQPGFVIFDTQNGDNIPSDYLYYELKRGSSTIKSGKISRATLQSGMFAIENLGYVYKLDDEKVRPLGYYIDAMIEVEGAAPSTPSGGATHISGKQYSFDVSSNAQYGESLTFDIAVNKTTVDDDSNGNSLRPKDDVSKYKYVINTSSSAPTASSINSNPTGSDTDGKFNYTVSSLTTQYYAHIIAVSYTGKISGVKTIKITPPYYQIKLDARGGTLKDDLSDNTYTDWFCVQYGRHFGYYVKLEQAGGSSFKSVNPNTNGKTKMPFYAEKKGYTFKGFYTQKSGGDCILKDKYVQVSNTYFTEDTTLYAQYTLNSYKLTINPNGGTIKYNGTTKNASFDTNFKYGNYTYVGDTPTRPGYTFDGWKFSNGSGGINKEGYLLYYGDTTTTTNSKTAYRFNGDYAGNVTVTAQWTPNKITFYYGANGGEVVEDKGYFINSNKWIVKNEETEKFAKVVNYSDSSSSTVNLSNMTSFGVKRPGYHLVSGKEYILKTSPTATTKSYTTHDEQPMSNFASYVKDGDVTLYLYANWAINTYTLTVDPSGGTWNGSTSPQSFTQNYDSTMEIPNPERVGYTFKGWKQDSSWTAGKRSGTTFIFGRMLDDSPFNNGGKGTLTAQWEAKQYEVTLDGNGATSTNHTTNVTATYDASLPSIVIPSREYTVTFNANSTNVTLSKTSEVAKYTFNGYFTATSGGTKYYTNTGTGAKVYDIANDTTFYAQWTPKSITMPTPTKTGYTFDGWYTSSTGGSKINGTTYTPSKNITLYAHWTPNIYTLTINPNGGVMWNGDSKVSSSFTTKFQYDRKTYMGNLKSNGGFEANNAPTRTGYTFNGFTFSGGTGGVNTSGSKFYFGGDANASCNTTTNTWVFNGNHAGDSTATAKWIANKYTINYYNGTTKLGSSNHTYDVSANLKTWTNLGGVVLNSEYGWTFAGWSTSSSSTTATYTDGQSVVNLTATDGDTINLYAVYKRTVTFKHGVSGGTTNKTTQYWNPNNTSGSNVSSPALAAITNWSTSGAPAGFRQDTIAAGLNYSANSSISPDVEKSSTLYGVYYRTITFKSGINASKTDGTPLQHLNSYNNTVSSITSGTPSAIANWTVLGYRDDTTIGGKEYGIASTISPAYTTGNTFYATYSRTLTIKYDANIEPPLTATGSVADTTKTIYMNSYKTNTSDQSVTLKANGFTYVGFKFLKWNIGNAESAYNPNLAYNHSTFVVVAKAVWEHDGSGVGTLKTPTLKVNNPNDKGIYYNNGIYFVKGDGKTIVELYGEAILNPTLITRVDKLSLNDGVDILTSNPTYKETYYVEVPKSDVLNGIYDKESVVNHNTHTGLFKTSGNPNIVDITQGKLSFTQKFTMIGQVIKEQYVGARASCMCKTCNDSSHTLSLYGNSIRLHSDPYKPYAYIIDESGTQVSIDAYDTKWTNQKKVTIEFKDDDSGIKYYKLTKGASIVKEVTNSSYSTKNAITLNLIEGATTYTLYVVDNVGNEITYTFTTHVDRTAPRLEDLVDFKVMGNGNVSQGRNEVYTGNNNTNPWPITNVNSIWEYDWQKLKTLEYKAADDGAGLRKVVITHYKQDSTYTNVWKSETLVNVEGDTINGIKDQLITSFNGDTYYLEGKSYLAIEIEDLPGNKTTVKLVIRRDKSNATISNMKVTPVSLENYTIEQLESMFASGDMSKFKTNVKFSINDNISTKDTSGIKKVEIVIKDAKTGVEIRRYDVTSNLLISSYTIETDNGSSRFSPLVRPLAGSINVNIDTLGDLPQYTYLNFYYEVTDYVGNKTVVQDKSVVDGGVKGEIPNYSIKTVMYATKDKAYNIPSTNGLTNMPYFKTGEIGYIKVWSIGYVDKLELDFSDGNIGQEMNQAIANGQISSKYILGVHNGLPNQVRYVEDMSKFKVNTNYPDYKGVPYASYISYSYDEVNNSLGNSGVDGWANKGTMIRIPQNHELVKKNKLDKYGNELYKWETHIANVYPIKGGVFGKPSGNYYTIWDESGDDLHFRITHLLFGY